MQFVVVMRVHNNCYSLYSCGSWWECVCVCVCKVLLCLADLTTRLSWVWVAVQLIKYKTVQLLWSSKQSRQGVVFPALHTPSKTCGNDCITSWCVSTAAGISKRHKGHTYLFLLSEINYYVVLIAFCLIYCSWHSNSVTA